MDPIGNEDFSRQLFLYLCQVIGSEKVVSIRRLFFRVTDDLLGPANSHRTFISSGSKAEGLNMAGSDLDIMFVDKRVSVFHNTRDNDDRIGLMADTEHAPPGFVYLRDNNVTGIIDSNLFTLTENGLVLSSKEFRAFCLRSTPKRINPIEKIHGPCKSDIGSTVDLLFCFKSQTWSTDAGKWFKRAHLYEWPPSSVVEMLATECLLYIPIGCKLFGVEESHPLLWRISFSVQEKLLVHSFNHTQLLCYALLKLVLKEIINAQSHVSNLLCSYFMKTTVFWMSEETAISEWNEGGLFRCFKSCIKRLIYWVRLEYCPNYFITDNNMFAGKIYGKKKTDLLLVLENLYSKDIHFISAMPSLINFDPCEEFCLDNKEQSDVDVALYPLLNLYPTLINSRECTYRDLLVLLTKIRNRRSSLKNSLYFQWLAYFCIQLLMRMPYKWQCNNKDFYTQYKKSRFYVLIGRNVDTVFGWLLCASFLYQHADYHNALAVTTSILPECTPDKCFILGLHPCMPAELNLDVLSFRHLTFLKRHKLCCIQEICLFPVVGSLFYISDLHILSCLDVPVIAAPPIVYLHFLRCICNHRLGNISERNECITDIELTIDEDFFIGLLLQRFSAHIYLTKTLEISKRKSKLLKVNENFLRQFIQSTYCQQIVKDMISDPQHWDVVFNVGSKLFRKTSERF